MTSPETLELEAVDAALAGRYVAPEHAELAELALLLRDERPEPTLVWTTHMDRRVEAGFPGRPRRRPRLRLGQWWKPMAVVTGLLVPVVLAAALAGSGTMGSEDDDGGGVSAAGDAGGGSEESSLQAPEPARDDASGGAVTDQAVPLSRSTKSGDPGSDARRGRKVERAASLTLATPRRDLDEVASRVGTVTADLGGFVARSTISSSGGGDIQLRVPSNRLDTAIQRISDLGRVRDLTRESQDITSQVVSARDRLTDARTERESLLRQLANADTLNETESIRARLAIVSQEIAAARNSLRRVNNRANFADVSVQLVPRGGDDADEGAWTPGDAFDDALRVLEVAAGVAVIAAAVVVPLLIAWLLGWVATRGVTRRRRERALDMA
jgi:Domain of unknown function (DUF4349)